MTENPPPRPAARRPQTPYLDQAALYGRGITTETVQQVARTAQARPRQTGKGTELHEALEKAYADQQRPDFPNYPRKELSISTAADRAQPLACDGDYDPLPEPPVPGRDLLVDTLQRMIGELELAREVGSPRAKTVGEQTLYRVGVNQAISRMAQVVFLTLRDGVADLEHRD